ncbi:MAG: SCO family protein [Niabella sp.]|nr:MAG: SCO family protein [Niabella sp.]
MKFSYLWLISFWFLCSAFNLPDEKKYLAQQAANIPLFDANGSSYPLYSLLKNKPLIISPVYTKCKSLCGLINHGVYKAIKDLGTLGNDFSMISFSFDSSDTKEDLTFYQSLWKMDGNSWRAVSAHQQDIINLMASVGFEYEYNPSTKEFNHPSILIVLTPSGKISRFIYGLNPSKKDIELAVIEAMAEQSRPGIIKGFYLRCFGYDPLLKTYKIDWRFIISTSAGLLIISLVSGIFIKSFIISKE